MPDRALSPCPVCGAATSADGGTGAAVGAGDPAIGLAAHLTEEAETSDVRHVMWLNRNVTKYRVGSEALAERLREWEAGGHAGSAAGDDRIRR